MGFIKNAFIFLSGAAAGSGITWFFTKTIYERFINDEMNKVINEEIEKKENDVLEDNVLDISNKAGYLKKDENFKPSFNVLEFDKRLEKINDKEDGGVKKPPYIISMNSAGEYDDYDVVTYTLYSDGTMTDDDGSVMDDESIADVVGKENLSNVGDSKDLLYVRNDELKLDIEIQYDTRSYDEFEESNPFVNG